MSLDPDPAYLLRVFVAKILLVALWRELTRIAHAEPVADADPVQ